MSSFRTLQDFTDHLDKNAVPFPLKVMGERNGPTATMLVASASAS